SAAKGSPSQVMHGRSIAGIQMKQCLEGFSGASMIAGAVQSNCQEISGMALGWKQVNGFAKRRYRGGAFLLVEKQDAKIEIGLRHFWVHGDGAGVFGASFIRSLQRRIDVGELKVRVRKFGLVGDDSLQRSNGRLEVFIVDIALSFLEQIDNKNFESAIAPLQRVIAD